MPPVHTHLNPFDWSGQPSARSGASAPTSSAPPLTAFYLTALRPTVLNCTVVGPRARVHYTVSTDGAMPGYTVVKRAADRKSIALVEWQAHPRVEIRGAVAKQETREWLRISRDQTYRTMTIRGAQYTWAPDNQYINLCSTGPIPRFLGRISRGDDSVFIELTPDALQLELLDTSVWSPSSCNVATTSTDLAIRTSVMPAFNLPLDATN
ncbi:hypothetical protein B0H17DRAFT_1251948 [Mycena rosella]|uniref:DUF6593 domain-containing protein n=1 Tax=Mycena rosella TaxID=1033263 RepID=A0AAD7CWQ7_MYCRO|nr:hypothetical protein B0H17DRAFT_1251948 [Mycena rosella]